MIKSLGLTGLLLVVVLDTGDQTLKVNQTVTGDVTMKTTFQKLAKGPVAIIESSANGESILLENTGRKVWFRINLR